MNPSKNAQATHTAIVVGAGFAGLGAAIALRKAGIDFVVMEKAGEVGGVWRDNTYPDCACDIPSAFYSYSFAPNPHWSRMFAGQAEIKAYSARTAEQFGLMAHVRLHCEMHTARWDDEAKTDGARVAVIGTGSTGVQVVSALQPGAAIR
jgi:cation diffusion facilitator CzcD-associated flavoprotein CzcO